MRTFDFVPEDSKFEGRIVMRSPNLYEKYDILEGLDVVNENGSIEAVKSKQISVIKKMIKATEAFTVSVDLTYKPTGEKFSTFESLLDAEECHPLLTSLATRLVGGSKMGEDLGRS